MAYDYKTAKWKIDIDSFERWKLWLKRFDGRTDDFSIKFCEKKRAYLREIQQRWPQFIKEDEIP